jgi:shikimate kinase
VNEATGGARRSPHLVLIGLMGAGKTTVGRACAARLGRGFVDTDDVIVTQTGQSIPELFATVGEAGFRAAERAALADVIAAPDPLVVACGGGAMGDAENRRAVRPEFVVWLTADAVELAGRVERDGVASRPLLAAGATAATLERLGAQRAFAYGEAADVVVETGGRSVDAVTTDVLDRYAEAAA